LAHLSKENNSPEMVKHLFEQHANETKIIIASRNKESEIYQINNSYFSEKKKGYKAHKIRDV